MHGENPKLSEASCTREINSRSGLAKAAISNKKNSSPADWTLI